jgi:hypothetical protein
LENVTLNVALDHLCLPAATLKHQDAQLDQVMPAIGPTSFFGSSADCSTQLLHTL